MIRGRQETRARVPSESECKELAARVMEMTRASKCQVEIRSSAYASVDMARSNAHIANDSVSVSLSLSVQVGDRQASGTTNQLDDSKLRAFVSKVEALTREKRTASEWTLLPPQDYPKGPQIFFDTTVEAMAEEAQAEIMTRVAAAAEASGLIAAAGVGTSATMRSVLNSEGLWAYVPWSYGKFSVTARTKDGTGSGWAGCGYEDWRRVNTDAVISKAIDIGVRSASPVALEPGRYTVILEPDAVAALIIPIIGIETGLMDARGADAGQTVFSKTPLGTNKIGLQMMDRRMAMNNDPWDPERPGSTIAHDWTPIHAVSWFRNGVLRNLAYSPDYARAKNTKPVNRPDGARLSVEGPSQTLEEMIASTRRGIWINRLSNVATMNRQSLLLTGTTRDGTFLIENGKITKAIKNLRFTESPFFVFNRLEAWGEPTRANLMVVAPRLKLRDFNFTSLTDAI